MDVYNLAEMRMSLLRNGIADWTIKPSDPRQSHQSYDIVSKDGQSQVYIWQSRTGYWKVAMRGISQRVIHNPHRSAKSALLEAMFMRNAMLARNGNRSPRPRQPGYTAASSETAVAGSSNPRKET